MVFKISAPWYVLVLNTAVFIVIALTLAYAAYRTAGQARLIALLVLGGLFLGLIYLFIITPVLTKLTLDDAITLSVPPYAKIKIEKKDVKSIRMVNLKTDKEYRPIIRSLGTSVGRYRLGKFLLKNGHDAVLMLNRNDAVLLETEAKDILASPDHFEEFKKALKEKGWMLRE